MSLSFSFEVNLYQKFLLFVTISQNKYQKYQNEKYFLVFLKSCIRGIRHSKNTSVLLRSCIRGIRMTNIVSEFLFNRAQQSDAILKVTIFFHRLGNNREHLGTMGNIWEQSGTFVCKNSLQYYINRYYICKTYIMLLKFSCSAPLSKSQY